MGMGDRPGGGEKKMTKASGKKPTPDREEPRTKNTATREGKGRKREGGAGGDT